jgi:hypothetical protein
VGGAGIVSVGAAGTTGAAGAVAGALVADGVPAGRNRHVGRFDSPAASSCAWTLTTRATVAAKMIVANAVAIARVRLLVFNDPP